MPQQSEPVMIVCPFCQGSGRSPLPTELEQTLDVFKAKPLCAEEVRRTMISRHQLSVDATTNAISNRLSRLMGYGYLQRIRRGKFWYYSKPAPTAAN